jgi:hypothetical protein
LVVLNTIAKQGALAPENIFFSRLPFPHWLERLKGFFEAQRGGGCG